MVVSFFLSFIQYPCSSAPGIISLGHTKIVLVSGNPTVL